MTKLTRAQALSQSGAISFRVDGLSWWAYDGEMYEGNMVHEIAAPSKKLREAIVDAARAGAITPGTGVVLLDSAGKPVEVDPSSKGDGNPGEPMTAAQRTEAGEPWKAARDEYVTLGLDEADAARQADETVRRIAAAPVKEG